MKTNLFIIGAGPAGIGAALAAAECGLSALTADERSCPGGRGWNKTHLRRMPGFMRLTAENALQRFQSQPDMFLPETSVWDIAPNQVRFSQKGKGYLCHANLCLIATGAMERAMPFPGWTIPGVVSAGGALELLDSDAEIPSSLQPIIFGNGPLVPLLLSVLYQKKLSALWADTGDRLHYLKALPFLASIRHNWPTFRHNIRHILHCGLPIQVREIRSEGTDWLSRVVLTLKNGKMRTINTALLIQHHGLIPETRALRLAGSSMHWDAKSQAFLPNLSEYGETSVPGIFAAGDCTDVLGAEAAWIRGQIAGYAASLRLGALFKEKFLEKIFPLQKRLKALGSFQRVMRRLFVQKETLCHIPDETFLCRCGHISAGEVRRCINEGHTDLNDLKRFTGCGMGECQGRMCEEALASVAAEALHRSREHFGQLRIRQPLVPIPLQSWCEASEEPSSAEHVTDR